MVSRQSLADQVATELRAKIEADFVAGEQLPAEIELASQMQVSRATLREAIGTLWKEGLLDRRWGVGTFVREAAPPVVASLTEATPTRDLISAGGHAPTLVLADIEQVEAGPEIASSLGVVPDGPIWRVQRIFAVDGTPMSYQVDYLPTTIDGKPVDPVPLKSIENDVIGLLKKVTGRSVVVFDVRVEAVGATGAVAEALAVPDGYPVIRLLHYAQGTNGSVIQIGDLHLRSDLNQLRLVRRG